MTHLAPHPSRLACHLTRALLLVSLSVLGASVGGCSGGGDSTPDAGPPPIDQCVTASDIGIMGNIAAMEDGGIPDGGVADGGPYPTSYVEALGRYMRDHCTGQGQPCFESILTESEIDMCLTQCFMGTAAEGLTLGCANCYVEIVQCGAENCITMCLGGDTPECDACVRASCTPRLLSCAGIP